ncbi:MAG TPA: PLP-dependent aminotransferase family protein [Burkholderiaceae bacterium]|jgi:DNA-binding transcriptional MocR family regulator|nr:PLP-dependent aminotransferase family protein [Burkholderiaceae bacterium]
MPSPDPARSTLPSEPTDFAAGASLSAVPLARSASQTLAEQLSGHYAARIRQRLLLPGARLPSVRDSARRHRVSPSTVVAAYDQLTAQGLVEARRQRGFFVRGADARRDAPLSSSLENPRDGALSALAGEALPRSAAPARPPPVDATALIRGMFSADARRPAPGMGTLPADWLDAAMLQSALRRVMTPNSRGRVTAGSALHLDAAQLHYGEPAGDARLRAALATRLADLGVRASAAQIVTTNGATHALDILSRTLLRPGDPVLVDEPGWSVEFARLTQLGARLLPVPRGVDGPDLEAMAALARAHRPRLYITVSVLHNPTGTSLSLAAAHQVLRLAEAHDFRIVEDDTYAHLAPAHAPRLAALDGLQRTFYVSGFSKILVPGWRVGYLVAPRDFVENVIDVKLLGTLTTAALLEQAVAVCLEQGWLRRHAERVVTRLAAARARSARLALAAGCRFVTPPDGLFGWVDTGVDTERLATDMLDDGWLIAPGTVFHAHREPSTLMRINFATSQDARFWKAFEAARRRA